MDFVVFLFNTYPIMTFIFNTYPLMTLVLFAANLWLFNKAWSVFFEETYSETTKINSTNDHYWQKNF